MSTGQDRAQAAMEVFLIPLGAGRYEPYCEVADGEPDASSQESGLFRGLVGRFREMLSAAERHGFEPGRAPQDAPTWQARLKARFLRWIAERIAEQRLLWHLRRQSLVVLVHPAGLAPDRARQVFRDALWRDRDRHRRWLVVHAFLFVLSGLLAVIPGPNLVAYYFAFRLVGHYLSFRGARHGLERTAWEASASDPLDELDAALALDRPARAAVVARVAAALGLERLPKFVDRMAR